jgi:hypothetical protein
VISPSYLLLCDSKSLSESQAQSSVLYNVALIAVSQARSAGDEPGCPSISWPLSKYSSRLPYQR